MFEPDRLAGAAGAQLEGSYDMLVPALVMGDTWVEFEFEFEFETGEAVSAAEPYPTKGLLRIDDDAVDGDGPDV